MSLVSHAFVLLVGFNIGGLIGWAVANARVTRPGEAPDDEPRGEP